MLPYIVMSFITLVNLYFVYYYIIQEQGPLWMGLLSLVAAVLFILIMIRYYRSTRTRDLNNFNSHIKSDDDRLLK